MVNFQQAILIVDDEFLNRFLLRKFLADLDFPLAEVENGEDAIDWIKNSDYTQVIILLDLNMPVMDGFEVINYLQTNSSEFADKQIEIIIVSASEFSDFSKKMPDAKIVDFLRKPCTKVAIHNSINKALENFK
ncbi:response regulator [Arcicella rigui]|uniref:Response regulator n=1 Tax=Arcicella rigui TaxID=797020 RepID=A0ABU5Q5J8_9BACT|nr:response regulator [Arcicella rigui]MEA5137893.1 response regulator [Arcicella rigui]